MKFKVGDRVRITRIAKSRERGWQNSWTPEMDATVGQIGTVIDISAAFRHDVDVNVPGTDGTLGYPDFVLRLVPKKKRVKK
jgi:hypothetical protein